MIGPAPIDFGRETMTSNGAVFRLEVDGRSLAVRPGRTPPPALMAGFAAVIIAFTVIAFVGARGLAPSLGLSPVAANLFAAALIVLVGTPGAIGIAYPPSRERSRGVLLSADTGSGRIRLPRQGKEFEASQLRSVWVGQGWTRSEGGGKKSAIALAQLSLVVEDPSGEHLRVPILTKFSLGQDLARLGEELAERLHIPSERHRLPKNLMPTTTEVSRISLAP